MNPTHCEKCHRPLGTNGYQFCRKCRRDENPNTRDAQDRIRSVPERDRENKTP